MIIINLSRIFKAKGIDKPYAFLMRAGFSANFASRAKNNQVRRLESKELEKLCVILNCTPNDLYEWVPDKDSLVDKDHELNKIRKTEKAFDITQSLISLSPDDLERVEAVLKETLKKRKEG